MDFGFVKRYANNRFFLYGSRTFGPTTKSIGIPVVKAAGRAVGVVGLTVDMMALQKVFAERNWLEFSRPVGFVGGDMFGFFPPTKFVPPLFKAVDLGLGNLFGINE